MLTLTPEQVSSSDSRPAVRLRASLARFREDGIEWDEAWRLSCHIALSGRGVADRAGWRAVFAWGEPYWRAAYLRAPFDGCSSLFLDS